MTDPYSQRRDRKVILLAALVLAAVMSGCEVDSPLGPGSDIPGMGGTVRDSASNATIAGVTIRVKDSSTVSGANGRYQFSSLGSFTSSLRITARKDGYVEYSATIDASRENAGYGIFYDISMSRSAVQ